MGSRVFSIKSIGMRIFLLSDIHKALVNLRESDIRVFCV